MTNTTTPPGIALDNEALDKLLPCPFCGGAARFERVGNWHDLFVDHVHDCLLSGDGAEMNYLDSPGVRQRMTRKWNQRANLAQARAAQPQPSAGPQPTAAPTPHEQEARAAVPMGFVLVDAHKLQQAAVQVKTGISWRGMELLEELASAAKEAIAAQAGMLPVAQTDAARRALEKQEKDAWRYVELQAVFLSRDSVMRDAMSNALNGYEWWEDVDRAVDAVIAEIYAKGAAGLEGGAGGAS